MELAQKAGVSDRGIHNIDYLAWAKSGLVAGLIGGLTFAAFELIYSVITKDDLFFPLRMLAGTVLGQQALTSDVSLWFTSFVGVIVHMVYSIISGAIFALVIAAVRPFHITRAAIITTASVFGLIMWLVNFFLIAPVLGWFWFPEQANQFWDGFVAHTFFYGTVVGWYLTATRK